MQEMTRARVAETSYPTRPTDELERWMTTQQAANLGLGVEGLAGARHRAGMVIPQDAPNVPTIASQARRANYPIQGIAPSLPNSSAVQWYGNFGAATRDLATGTPKVSGEVIACADAHAVLRFCPPPMELLGPTPNPLLFGPQDTSLGTAGISLPRMTARPSQSVWRCTQLASCMQSARTLSASASRGTRATAPLLASASPRPI